MRKSWGGVRSYSLGPIDDVRLCRRALADVIESIEAVGDETVVLPDSEIGELSILARRRGTMWVLAVMSAGPARTIQVPPSFLGDGRCEASLVRTNRDKADAVVLANMTVQRRAMLTIGLADGGGCVARFVK